MAIKPKKRRLGCFSYFIIFVGVVTLYWNQPYFGVRYCLTGNKIMYDWEMVDLVKPVFLRRALKSNRTRPNSEVIETVDILFGALKECFAQHTAKNCESLKSAPLPELRDNSNHYYVSPEKFKGKKHISWRRSNDGTGPFVLTVRNIDKKWKYSITRINQGCIFRDGTGGTIGNLDG